MGITLCRAAESLSKIEPQLSWRVQQYAVDVMKMQSKLVELSPLIGATMSDLNLVDLVQKTTERLKALQMPVGVVQTTSSLRRRGKPYCNFGRLF